MSEKLTDEEQSALTIMRDSGFYYTHAMKPDPTCVALAERGLAIGEKDRRDENVPVSPHPARYRITDAGRAALSEARTHDQ
jgi:hypothetical protein